ncbi:MAG: phosphoribosylformylglycinamidine cyclo-ligase [Acidimicrobiia bacterium]|nr:phosphoribosylformylglycinamidine cyclo-ligase [Acidimicrobiia bacterium]
MGETYAAAGVDIAAGDAAVERIKPHVTSTTRPEVIGALGGFGGLFDVSTLGYDHPVLVSGTDGVGTKALVATMTGRYDTIGIDLVAMCVDDLVCGGAEPLFFLDYISAGKVDPAQMESLVDGIATGCRQAGCALIGGEMAEHPGVMQPGEFDLVGFAVGVVERDRIVGSDPARPGDVLIALGSPGLRSNGYSLARRLLFDVAGLGIDDRAWAGAPSSVADELLRPSIIYSPAMLSVIRAVPVRAIAHITGGGIPGNLSRVLPADVDAVVDRTTWTPPPIFAELRSIGAVAADEMDRTFNMGVGMIAAVDPADEAGALAILGDAGVDAWRVGALVGGSGLVTYEGETAPAT